MFTLRQYLDTLTEPDGLLRDLHGVEIRRDPAGRPRFVAGNSAAIFRVRYAGRECALRCWYRPQPTARLRALYGDELREKGLFVYRTPRSGEWVDVALCDWIEGPTLHEAATGAALRRDTGQLRRLSRAFDAWAASTVADDEAWGDLKPENLIVDTRGAIRPIDRDARFRPAFAGERSPELGTAAYQHPARTIDDFDARLDDYPAAAISATLAALALDPRLLDRYGTRDGLLLDPSLGSGDPARREALALFERQGDAPHYRIARLLASPTLRLPGLAALLEEAAREEEATPKAAPAGSPDAGKGQQGPATAKEPVAEKPTAHQAPASAEEPPELFVEAGLWGFRSGGRTVVSPLYDCAFDFTEGLAAVRLGATWHYIDPSGRTRISCPGCEAVKPFRGGQAEVRRDGRRFTIGREGKISE